MILSILAFLLALGPIGHLWSWQAKLPILDKFNHPLKFLPFFHLYACALGAVVLNRVLCRTATPGRWLRVCFLLVASLMLYHVWWARSAFFLYAETPYPLLPKGLLERAAGFSPAGGIMPLTPSRSRREDFVAGLPLNFPSVYGIGSLLGYDPLVEQKRSYQSVLRGLIRTRSELSASTVSLIWYSTSNWPIS